MLGSRHAWFAIALGTVAAGCVLLTDLDGLSGGDVKEQPESGADAKIEDAGTMDVAVEAGPPEIGRGDGHLGPFEVTGISIVNTYTAIVAAAAAGATSVAVESSTGFEKGDAVIVWQTAGLPSNSAVSGDPVAFAPLPDVPPGRYHLARVAAASGTSVALDRALPFSTLASGAQLVRVPEYGVLTVRAGAEVRAPVWNGRSGGLLAILVSDQLTLEGVLSADGAGFRGGIPFLSAALFGCDANDGLFSAGFAAKGEGLVTTNYVVDAGDGSAMGGRGNLVNGGGGGVCHNAGGAGGGNAGPGGAGGFSFDGARNVGGKGGAVLGGALESRLWMGGGGGAGQGESSQGETASGGGAGAGVIFVRAKQLVGAGVLRANGVSGESAIGNGGGGGGAGGSIFVVTEGTIACASASAIGGDGGSLTGMVGPGGGGAGGHVRLIASGKTCPVDVSGGAPGMQDMPDAESPNFGATPGTTGVIE